MTTTEKFPVRASLRTRHAMLRNQGSLLTCLAFGPTSTLDTLLHRLGIPVNLSARFLLWNMRSGVNTIEGAFEAIETGGMCLDELCPYDVTRLGEMPSHAAFTDAKTRLPKGIRPISIAGTEAMMRSIGQGSPMVFKMANGNGSEHVSCIDGYGPEGLHVLDSIGQELTMPMSAIESGGSIKQLYRIGGLPLIQHPDYIEGDLPSLRGGILTLPAVKVWRGWEYDPRFLYFKNVVFRMLTCDPVENMPGVRDSVFWHSSEHRLYIPKMYIDDRLAFDVTITRPTAELISHEPA